MHRVITAVLGLYLLPLFHPYSVNKQIFALLLPLELHACVYEKYYKKFALCVSYITMYYDDENLFVLTFIVILERLCAI